MDTYKQKEVETHLKQALAAMKSKKNRNRSVSPVRNRAEKKESVKQTKPKQTGLKEYSKLIKKM
jgi:hypothetical protein